MRPHRLRPHAPRPSDTPPPIRGIEVQFGTAVSMADVTETLELAKLGAESLHGSECVALEAACSIDRRARTVAIHTATSAGRTTALVFLVPFPVHECRVGRVRR